MDLSKNDLLTGTLPLDNSLKDSITILDLSGTDFTNTFNSILKSLPKLSKFLPASFSSDEICIVCRVQFRLNIFTPHRLLLCYVLFFKPEFLNVGRTFMSGSIPTDIGELVPNLQHLHLSWNNGIEGTIPSEIGNLSNLGKCHMWLVHCLVDK